jgi:hypothetical protein
MGLILTQSLSRSEPGISRAVFRMPKIASCCDDNLGQGHDDAWRRGPANPLKGVVHVLEAASLTPTDNIAVAGSPFNIVAVGGSGESHDH